VQQNLGDWQDKAFDILRLVRQGIILTDESRRIVFLNGRAEEMFGWTAAELVGEPLSVLFMEDDVEILFENIFMITDRDGEFSGETLLKGRKERRRFCWLSSSLYKTEDSKLFIFSIHDISEYKKMEKEFLESDRFTRMGKIFEQLAHHIRNPVVSIGGFARVLRKSSATPEKQQRYLETIEKETARLERIVARIMEFGHVDEPRYSWGLIGTLIHSWEAMAGELIRDKRIRFQPFVDPDIVDIGIFTDKDMLLGALMHLLENGIEALKDEEDTVLVSVQVSRGDLIVKIEDSGVGIPLSDQMYVFDPFFTTKSTRVGLGLTIANSVIRELGGRIEVESKPGVGSTFTVFCPLERRSEIRTRLLA